MFCEDYMVVRLSGNPAAKYGYYPLSDQDLDADTQLMLIGHPNGGVMQADWGNECRYQRESNGTIKHRCDTSPGNSGSGILLPAVDEKGSFTPEGTVIVGVHAFGGCDSGTSSYNSGPGMQYLSEFSEFIQSLIPERLFDWHLK